MHIEKKINSTLSIFAILLSFIAHGNEIKINSTANSHDTLLYSYRDAPVAPEYRRNYTIRITARKVRLVVDSYDKIILKKNYSLTKAAYDSFARAVDVLHIKNRKEVKGPACIGGTSENLLLYPGTGREVKGYINYCGDDGPYGSLEGDIRTAAKLFKELIPGLDEKIEATIKDGP